MVDIERMFREKIAASHNVSPEEVDMDFIDKNREELYANPKHRFLDNRGLKVMNQLEIEAQANEAEKFLRQFAQPAPSTNSPSGSSK